jgi:hypothetical protein
MGTQITGLYPTLIIVIVNFQRTFWEEGPSKVGNNISLNTLPWSVKRTGPTDTLDTQRGVEVQVTITRENSVSTANQNAKRLSSDDV